MVDLLICFSDWVDLLFFGEVEKWRDRFRPYADRYDRLGVNQFHPAASISTEEMSDADLIKIIERCTNLNLKENTKARVNSLSEM